MDCNWEACSSDIKGFVFSLLDGIKKIIEDECIGFYLHGSLAMGGFNPKNSDIDVLAITNKALSIEIKRKLAKLLLTYSNDPFPVEISFLNKEQLKNWKHPSPYDFHYSEYWRERYENDLSKGTEHYLNEEQMKDPDLAAHFTIISHRGICIEGRPINELFPHVPRAHYISSIMNDFQDCLEDIEQDPTYCVLNLTRVYLYLKEGVISSKKEAGKWGMEIIPKELNIPVQKAVNNYQNDQQAHDFEKNELLSFSNYIKRNVQELL